MPPLRLPESVSDVRPDNGIWRCERAPNAYIAGVFWLVFSTPRGPCVILQPASHLIHARLAAGVTHQLDPTTFSEGHQLDAKTIRKIPKDMIGKCLSSRQAQQLLKRLGTR
jgi:hypothetical protein